jgi:hypothetical protein
MAQEEQPLHGLGNALENVIEADGASPVYYSIIYHGKNNRIAGSYATIPGGLGNTVETETGTSVCVYNQPTNLTPDDAFLFTVGNGAHTDRSNAMSVATSGVVRGQTFESSAGDYAIYFEARPNDVLPVGTSVTVDEDGYLRAASGGSGSIPIGVVRPKHPNTSCVVGNAYEDHWHGKYERQTDGGYTYSVALVEAVDPNTPDVGPVMGLRRTVSSAYDPSRQYIPRSQRPEWHLVGLSGCVWLRRGQPVDPRWVRLRAVKGDASADTYESWLIR